jgi:hypothetical protein
MLSDLSGMGLRGQILSKAEHPEHLTAKNMCRLWLLLAWSTNVVQAGANAAGRINTTDLPDHGWLFFRWVKLSKLGEFCEVLHAACLATDICKLLISWFAFSFPQV